MACTYLNYGDIVPIGMEIFDFDIESDDDDEVFFGDVGFTEKCIAYELNADVMCHVEPLPELTTEQWKEMEREAYKVVAVIREIQEKCDGFITGVPTIGTPSLSQSTRLKRKLQSLSQTPIKQSPLLDITNRSNTRSNKSSVVFNTNNSNFNENSLDFSPILKNVDPRHEQLDFMKPMCLNFDDIEPSPKKIRCFNAFMSPGKDLPLLINETCEGLYMNSPTAKDVVPFDFNLNEANLECSMRTPTRKSQHLNQKRSVTKCRTPTVVKEPCTPESFNKKTCRTPVDEVKRSHNSILNVSFTMDGDESFLKKLGDPELLKTPSVKVSKMLVTSGGSLVASGKKSENVLTHKIAGKPEVKGLRSSANENLSCGKGAKLTATRKEKEHSAANVFSSDKVSELSETLKRESRKICQDDKEMIGHKELRNEKDLIVGVSETALNRSFTIENTKSASTIENNESALNKALLIDENEASLVVDAKSFLTDSFVKSTPNETVAVKNIKTILDESFTLLETETPALIESFTDKITETSLLISFNANSEKLLLNESFTVDSKKLLLNESFTIDSKKTLLNESFTVDTKNPQLNESFTVKNKTPLLNESFTVKNKTPPLNESFTVKNKTPPLNESFTVINKTPPLNQSFTVKSKKPLLNESFTVENKKPVLNASFTVESEKPLQSESIGDNEIISNELSIKGRKTNVRKSSQTANIPGTIKRASINKSSTKTEKSIKNNCTSDHQNLQDKSTSKSKTNPVQKPVRNVLTTFSRKRPLDSPRQSLGHSKGDTKAKSDQKSLTLENKVTSKLTQAVPSKLSYNVKKPDMSFDKSSNIPKDEHGMVKFQEKSNIVVKKAKSTLLLPRNRVLKKPEKDSTTVNSTTVENSSLSNIKRKCLMSTPVLSRNLTTTRIPTSGSKEAGKSKMVLPIKLQQPLMALDVSKPNSSSQAVQKGPVKAIHQPVVKAPVPVSTARSKLPMPSRSRIPQMK